MPAGKIDFGIFQNQSFVYYQLTDAFEVKNAGNGIKKEINSNRIEIYPNPTSGLLVIDNKKEDFKLYKILNLKGELLFEGHLDRGNNQVYISKETIGQQLFILQLIGDQSFFQKIILE